ncbi:MAG: polysaccharide biosynthesis tyrosine autokinase, partial [Acidimicrobiales bacterium]|nr:polysaccharide biosynthesis tyrosine autokinase [Acidimicrobiales bacterium]
MHYDELSLSDYIGILRRRWHYVVGAFLVLIAMSLVYSLLQTPLYRAQAEVLVDLDTSSQLFDPVTGARRSETRVIDTEVKFVKSTLVADAVREALGFGGGVSAAAADNADVIEIISTSTDPDRAALVANTYAETYISLRRELAIQDVLATAEVVQDRIDELTDELRGLSSSDPERDRIERTIADLNDSLDRLDLTSQLSGGTSAQIISPAEAPSKAYVPQTTRNAVLAAVVGLILGVGLALLREFLDDSIKDKSDLEMASPGVANLALIPEVMGWKDEKRPRIISLEDPTSDTSEAYRTLRTALQFLSIERQIKILQLTSPKPSEGKTTTTANLAVALARAGKRVILVDCDLRKPRLHTFFDLDNEPGVTNVLLGEVPLSSAIRRVHDDLKLAVLPSGPPPPDPSEILAGRATADLFEMLRGACDIVIIDSPPTLPVADPLVIA